mmetsp:Transcript_7939/g.23448  ORF Transcript_7939/g.23448 Transcript_7939/m.23448 type:complete len:264 (-) Transcript_7939:921-1712(-)
MGVVVVLESVSVLPMVQEGLDHSARDAFGFGFAVVLRFAPIHQPLPVGVGRQVDRPGIAGHPRRVVDAVSVLERGSDHPARLHDGFGQVTIVGRQQRLGSGGIVDRGRHRGRCRMHRMRMRILFRRRRRGGGGVGCKRHGVVRGNARGGIQRDALGATGKGGASAGVGAGFSFCDCLDVLLLGGFQQGHGHEPERVVARARASDRASATEMPPDGVRGHANLLVQQRIQGMGSSNIPRGRKAPPSVAWCQLPWFSLLGELGHS